METLFGFEEEPSEPKPLKDWAGNEMPVSDNPMVRRYGRMEGKQCKECKFLLRDYYHNKTYIKCELRKLTRGPGSDHRARWEACKKFEQEEPEAVKEEPPKQPYSEICPQCKGPIKILYSWGVWACPACNIKIAQSREGGITRIEPMLKFGISPLERRSMC